MILLFSCPLGPGVEAPSVEAEVGQGLVWGGACGTLHSRTGLFLWQLGPGRELDPSYPLPYPSCEEPAPPKTNKQTNEPFIIVSYESHLSKSEA